MTEIPGIAFQNVSLKRKGATSAMLRDLDVEFYTDRSTAILGASASTFRSLIGLMTGAARATTGRVVRNCAVSFPIGFVPSFGRYLTGMQNAIFLARIYGVDIDETVEFVRNFSELGDAFEERMIHYSPEQKAQLFFALSYSIPFDMYVSTGSLVGGSAAFREKCKAHIQNVRRHAGIIVTTKSPIIARLFCDTVYVLHERTLIPFDDVRTGLRFYASINARKKQNPDAEDIVADDDADDEVDEGSDIADHF